MTNKFHLFPLCASSCTKLCFTMWHQIIISISTISPTTSNPSADGRHKQTHHKVILEQLWVTQFHLQLSENPCASIITFWKISYKLILKDFSHFSDGSLNHTDPFTIDRGFPVCHNVPCYMLYQSAHIFRRTGKVDNPVRIDDTHLVVAIACNYCHS